MIFYFRKGKRPSTVDSYIVLLIKKKFLEFNVDAPKKTKIYVNTIKIGNENAILLLKEDNIKVCLDSITDESNSTIVVAVSLEVSGRSSSEEIETGSYEKGYDHT